MKAYDLKFASIKHDKIGTFWHICNFKKINLFLGTSNFWLCTLWLKHSENHTQICDMHYDILSLMAWLRHVAQNNNENAFHTDIKFKMHSENGWRIQQLPVKQLHSQKKKKILIRVRNLARIRESIVTEIFRNNVTRILVDSPKKGYFAYKLIKENHKILINYFARI